MLTSVTIQRRQSEIRQALAGLVANDTPDEAETRQIEALDREFRANEVRYRAALIAEDSERREAGAELGTRTDRDFADLVAGFEMRQVALFLDEGRALEGRTAEIVTELRSRGGYRGVPVPLAALETRAGETIASGVPNPIRTAPIVDRLFADSVASKMGVQTINIDSGLVEYPVVTSAITAGWAPTETSNVPGPTQFATDDRTLKPNQNLGIQVKVTRRALKQAGAGLEQAIRRDMAGAIQVELDKAVFRGTGTNGEPLGIIPGAATYGITSTAIDEPATWASVRAAVVRFMLANAVTGPDGVRLMVRPEVWDASDDLITGLAISEFDLIRAKLGAVVLTTNALAAPAQVGGTGPFVSSGLLTTMAGGLPPAFLGLWGAVDLIRDPYTDAASGQLRITGLLTADVMVARGSQLEILTGIQ
jgi:HK97 family phage major capsid protein